jgi:hypothetical protein
VLSADEIVAALHGVSVGLPADLKGLANMLTEARYMEGYFDSEGSRALRANAVQAYERTRRPSTDLFRLAADALHSMAGGYWADNEQEQAFYWAKEARRRFPDADPDPIQYAPPIVTMLERAAVAVSEAPTGRLVVALTEPGEVLVDGRSIGRRSSRFDTTLPAGRYVLRVVSEAGTSFSRIIEIEAHGQLELAIDSAFERCVRLVPRVALTCPEKLQETLRSLMTATRAGRAIAMIATGEPDEVREIVLPGTLDESLNTTQFEQFEPLYLLPFGGGQFAQGRLRFAGAYATAGAAAVAWYAFSQIRFLQLNDGLHVHEANDASSRVQLSLWVLAGTAVITAAEALIVGWLYGGTDFR